MQTGLSNITVHFFCIVLAVAALYVAVELTFMDNISCHRIAMAIRMISGDAQGKEALKQMQTIKLRNVKTIGEKSLEYAHGASTLVHWYTHTHTHRERERERDSDTQTYTDTKTVNTGTFAAPYTLHTHYIA